MAAPRPPPKAPASYSWHLHSRKPARPASPLDRYCWRTSGCPLPAATKMAATKMAAPEEPGSTQQRLLSLPRLRSAPGSGSSPGSGPAHSPRRLLPFVRSTSEPGGSAPCGAGPGQHAGIRTPSVSSFFSAVTRRISGAWRAEPEPAAQSGMGRVLIHHMIDSTAGGRSQHRVCVSVSPCLCLEAGRPGPAETRRPETWSRPVSGLLVLDWSPAPELCYEPVSGGPSWTWSQLDQVQVGHVRLCSQSDLKIKRWVCSTNREENNEDLCRY